MKKKISAFLASMLLLGSIGGAARAFARTWLSGWRLPAARS